MPCPMPGHFHLKERRCRQWNKAVDRACRRSRVAGKFVTIILEALVVVEKVQAAVRTGPSRT